MRHGIGKMDQPWPCSLDPAHQPEVEIVHCYECGVECMETDDYYSLCEQCQEIASLPCEEESARGAT